MTAKTKAQLSAEQASIYADNVLGLITANSQRIVTQDVIDSACTLLDDNTFTSQTNSLGPTSGSLVLTGGVGIGKDVFVGGVIYGSTNYVGPAMLSAPATAPTRPPGDNTTNIATTAFVSAAIVSSGALTPSNVNPLMNGTAAPGVAIAYSRGDHVHPTDTSRAPLASPTFTGVPAAPTAAAFTNNTQLATTAYVDAKEGAAIPLINGTAAAGTSHLFSRQDHVHPTDTSLAPLASPVFTGTPQGPTAVVNTNTVQLATTAFVLGQAGTASPLMDGTVTVGTSLLFARQDHVHPSDTTRAPLASPALTGTPTAPTPSGSDNSTTIATTAFVQAAATLLVRAVRIQKFTASGTYTPNANMLYCIIECIGGGAGGGFVTGATNFTLGAGGGGSGGFSRLLASKATIGASQAVTIGTGGAGGVGGSAGGNGSATSVGSLCVANGGFGGAAATSAASGNGGAGASAGTGDVAAPGNAGGTGWYISVGASGIGPVALGGAGGAGHFGGSGNGAAAGGAAANGGAATYYGSGGGGAANNTTGNATGGAGFAGVAIITEFCSA